MYAWYEDDLADFFLMHDLPAYNMVDDIKIFYESYKEKFMTNFSRMIKKDKNRSFDKKFYSEIENCQKDIVSNFDLILKILYAYDESDMKLAQDYFDQLMSTIYDNLFITTISGVDNFLNGLYRIRQSTEKTLLPHDLFHIPYDKRHLITNERYSLSGHPCIYLATFLGIAWQECGYPKKFVYSEFKINSEFKDMDDWRFIHFITPRKIAQDYLCAINEKHNTLRLKLICDYLKTFPLILACSFVNLKGHSVFKSEYIIPQMLTQWVRRNFNKIKGILYFTCHDNDSLMSINGYNIVIPATNIKDGKWCDTLKKAFLVSNPIYSDNTLSTEDCETINTFTKELRFQISEFPSEAFQCMVYIYEVASALCNLIKCFETSDMKLLLKCALSIRTNCAYINSNYPKSDLLNMIDVDSHLDSAEDRKALFVKYYDRFQSEIVPIIQDYCYEIDKVITPKITEFFEIK